MRIVIEAHEAIMTAPGGKCVGDIYGINVSTESTDEAKEIVRKATDAALAVLKLKREDCASISETVTHNGRFA